MCASFVANSCGAAIFSFFPRLFLVGLGGGEDVGVEVVVFVLQGGVY